MTRQPRKTLADLATVRAQIVASRGADRTAGAVPVAAPGAPSRPRGDPGDSGALPPPQTAAPAGLDAESFRREMEALAVRPLRAHGRHRSPVQPPAPQAHSRQRDDAEALQASLADEIDLESLIDTDESLSYRAAGVSPDVPRRLRRGQWSIRAEIDLHGHRVDEARAALALFLKEALRAHLRCVRVVHGKGLGSHGRTPVLKGRVRAWLAQREEVIAFCQAPPAEGGSGALLVLLRPTGNAPERGD